MLFSLRKIRYKLRYVTFSYFSSTCTSNITYATGKVPLRHTETEQANRKNKQAQDGASFVLVLLASCQRTCTTYTTAVCTVKNS